MTPPRAPAPLAPLLGPLGRRDFLVRSGLAWGALSLATFTLPACPAPAAPPFPLGVLTPRSFAALAALSSRLAGGGADGGAIARRVDDLLRREDPPLQARFRRAILVAEYGPPVLGGGFSRFTALSPPRQDAYLARLAAHRLVFPRILYTGLKNVCLFAFYSIPSVWPELGYDGPWVGRDARP